MVIPGNCRVIFPEFSRTVNLVGCAELEPAFASIMLNWNHELRPGLSEDADMSFTRVGKKYDWVIKSDGLRADELDGKPETLCDAASDFHYELYRWYRSAFPQHLCLHAATSQFDQGAVIFPTTFESGKSILSVALASRGVKSLGDDVIALDTNAGDLVSLGLMPRVRLPLPLKALGAPLTAFLKERQSLVGRQDSYVRLTGTELAGLGERGHPAGVVMLARSAKYLPARLSQVSAAEALRALIAQNFNTTIDVQTIFNVLKAVVTGGRNFKLVYSDLGEVYEILKTEFGHA